MPEESPIPHMWNRLGEEYVLQAMSKWERGAKALRSSSTASSFGCSAVDDTCVMEVPARSRLLLPFACLNDRMNEPCPNLGTITLASCHYDGNSP
jgi:hypothetical protein